MARRDTWIDSRFEEVRDVIETEAARLQRAGNSISSAAGVLANIPDSFSDLVNEVETNGTDEQKSRLQSYTDDFQAVKAVADAANDSTETQALRDLEV